jgi:hypothetical protein
MCELLQNPRLFYRNTSKFLQAFSKVVCGISARKGSTIYSEVQPINVAAMQAEAKHINSLHVDEIDSARGAMPVRTIDQVNAVGVAPNAEMTTPLDSSSDISTSTSTSSSSSMAAASTSMAIDAVPASTHGGDAAMQVDSDAVAATGTENE